MSKDKKIKPRVKVPKSVAAGEFFTVKTLINHRMESGQRKDKKTGENIPRKIINLFEAVFNGTTVVAINVETAISTNPFFEFSMKINEPGDLLMKWTDDDGSVYETTKSIAIG
jgi:sulfur-oxidizing protein SoxZ